jgi:glycosyltransferase involved in cell wall biosynthesis
MLSIIIPYYKHTFFEATLQSLVSQTDKRFKVYIGDDGSPESPIALLEKYKDQFDFIYHRFNENLGGISLVQQWNRCIGLAGEEEWVMILGDDDVLGANCIKDFYVNLPQIFINKCNVVRYATIINDVVQQTTSSLYTHPKLEKGLDFFYRRFTNQTRSSLSEYIFKKSIYQKYGFYDYELAWHSDDRAWLEFSEFKHIYSINSAQVSFRFSHENISRGNYKTEEKQKVALQFYKFVMCKYFNKLKRYQRKDLLLYYEQLVYKDKRARFFFWVHLFLLFMINGYFIQSIKFTRRLFIFLKTKD